MSISVIPIHRSDVSVKYAMLTILEDIVNISVKYWRSVPFLKVIVDIALTFCIGIMRELISAHDAGKFVISQKNIGIIVEC